MAEPFLSEIRLFSFVFPPRDWALCNGQLLPINQNQALFSLLGTTFGGDGRVNFGLPDMRGRTPIHVGNGHTLGERGGEQAHTLSVNELPVHTHALTASSLSPTTVPATNEPAPAGNYWADGGQLAYAPTANTTMAAQSATGTVGGSQAHLNMSPFLALSFCIALQSAIFPTQN
jgi:microcystin-dependent protein